MNYLRTCLLCKSTCGLELTVDGGRVTRVRGDRDDVFSKGYLCPKGMALGHLHEDPDRLRVPVVREGDTWREVSWDDAFAEVERRLAPILERHGRDALALYFGDPCGHNLSLACYSWLPWYRVTRNMYSASTVCEVPKEVSAALMFGTHWSVPLADLDRTRYLLVLGANPWTSNGSLLTAPNILGRLDAIRAGGGKVVVVDPRRTTTAKRADEHIPIRPGTDALLLMAMVHVLFTEQLVDLGPLAEHTNGVDEMGELARDWPPELVADACAIPAGTIRRLARELAAAEAAAVYGRMGTCTQEFGTLASWLVDVLNVLTGNLDRPGGAMFSRPPAGATHTHGAPGTGRGFRIGGYRSRVRGAPEVLRQFPAVCLAEEIDTPGEGQVRALLTIAGNPVLSVPGSSRLQAALPTLECMVSVDNYLNETTRHAHVILPGESFLQLPHYDTVIYQFAVRNVGNWSDPVFPPDHGRPAEWEVLLKLWAIVNGQGAGADVEPMDDAYLMGSVRMAVGDPSSPVHGRDAEEVFALAVAAAPRGPERIVDFQIRTGPYGDGYGARSDGLTLEEVRRHPHGLDLGPHQPRIPEVLRTPSGKIELAPSYITADLPRLRAAIGRDHSADGRLLLVGRRDLRSNNSWLHNIPALMRGRNRCTLLIHPDDAARCGVAHGAAAAVASEAGTVVVPVEVSDEMMPGVVSLPHGWGHGQPGTRLRVAAEHSGVNSNLLADAGVIEPLSGVAVVNGIPVTVAPEAPA
jgi:anaerobic selenocysteine-containing dehydrogenase